MNLSTYYTPAKVADLKAAFDRVAPVANWKLGIDVTLDASVAELGVIKEAITFYTGSVARISVTSARVEAGSASTVVTARVVAAGYYAAIGA